MTWLCKPTVGLCDVSAQILAAEVVSPLLSRVPLAISPSVPGKGQVPLSHPWEVTVPPDCTSQGLILKSVQSLVTWPSVQASESGPSPPAGTWNASPLLNQQTDSLEASRPSSQAWRVLGSRLPLYKSGWSYRAFIPIVWAWKQLITSAVTLACRAIPQGMVCMRAFYMATWSI